MRNRFQRQPPKHAVTARLHLAEGITERASARHGSGHRPTLFIDTHPCGPAPTAGNAPKRPMRPSHTARFVRQNDRFWQAKRPALQCTETQVVGQRGTDVNIILQKQMPHTPPRQTPMRQDGSCSAGCPPRRQPAGRACRFFGPGRGGGMHSESPGRAHHGR